MFKKFVFSLFIVGMLVGPLTTNASTFTSLKAQLEYISNKIANFGSDTKGEVLGVSASDVVVNISASPANVPFGGSTTITWTTINATSCIADAISPISPNYNWPGVKPINGSQTITNINYHTRFFMTCFGINGDTKASVLVLIKNINPKIELKANPSLVVSGGSSVISYKVTEADSCEGYSTPYYSNWRWYKGFHPIYEDSVIINNITENSVFYISCTANGQTFVRSVKVNVQNISGPTCDYPVPPKDCTYIQGPNYNPATNCGLILDCKIGNTDDGPGFNSGDVSVSRVTTANNFCSFTFTKNLGYGNLDTRTSKDVSYLQSILVDERLLPSSSVTGRFYAQTRTALANLQRKYGISQTGRVDINTRIKLNELFQNYCQNS
jgi:hypothetical protein